jgi:hypothetical protein
MEIVTYPFTPITNEAKLEQATAFVAEKAIALGETVLGRPGLELDTICFFAHTPEEYTFLQQAVLARGPQSRFTHGATLYADTNFVANGHTIKLFGVRDVTNGDPARTQVGYGDYPVNDYDLLLIQTRHNQYINQITSGRGKPLIELRHPDFDVLGFVVDERLHQA